MSIDFHTDNEHHVDMLFPRALFDEIAKDTALKDLDIDSFDNLCPDFKRDSIIAGMFRNKQTITHLTLNVNAQIPTVG